MTPGELLIDDGVHGLLVDAGDVDALADTLSRVIEDRALRERLASAGRQRVQQSYSSSAILPQLCSIYATVSRSPAELGSTLEESCDGGKRRP